MLRSSLAGFSSLEGKVAVVTSACHDSDDVGWNIAHQLVLRGAKV
jgi:NAD(P)-dependent dehydrogenase (short-subunit alcohol dehydrogenase family)